MQSVAIQTQVYLVILMLSNHNPPSQEKSYCTEKFICRRWFRPFGLYLGIKASSHKKPPTNEVLEQEFQAMKTDKKLIPDTAELSARLGLTERQIQHWLRRRKLHGMSESTFRIKFGGGCLILPGSASTQNQSQFRLRLTLFPVDAGTRPPRTVVSETSLRLFQDYF